MKFYRLLPAYLYLRSDALLAEWVEPFKASVPETEVITVTSESADAVTTITWATRGLAILAATALLIMSAKRLHREDYYGAMLTFVGAILAGASPYLSTMFFLG